MGQNQQVRQLLDRGLTCYGLGKLEEAISCWQQVLDLDPHNERAREYLSFVKSNWGPPAKEETGPTGTGASPQGSTPPGSDQPQAATAPAGQGQHPRAFVKPAVGVTGWGDLFGPAPAGQQPAKQAVETATPTVSPEPASPPVASTPAVANTPPESGQHSVPATLPPLPPVPEEPTAEAVPPEPSPAPPTESTPAATAGNGTPTRTYESVPTIVRPPTEPITADQGPAGTEAIPAETGPPPAAETAPAPAADAWGSPPASTAIPAPGVSAEADVAAAANVPATSQPATAAAGGDPLELVTSSATPDAATAQTNDQNQDVQSLMRGIRDLLELDDFTGARELLDKLLALEPDNQEALALRADAEKQLTAMYLSKVGKLEQVPRVRISQEELIWLNLDHRAGFVLSLVDGRMSYDEILSICGLPQVEALRILAELLQEQVIEVS